nr:hypothetical protein [Methylobacterium sp. L1A1]
MTLADFGFDGRAVLDHLVAASGWGSIEQAIASLAVFAHPDVVAAVGARALFRTVRGKQRGKIVDGLMVDDNSSPAVAFEISTGFKRRPGSNIQCCHLYAASTDPQAFTDLRNIFMMPTCLAKLTDSQAATLPDTHALHVLRYRAYALYGYQGPGRSGPPAKPAGYDGLKWADPLGAGAEAECVERQLRKRLGSRPRDRLTKSVALCGWTFTDYRPDPDVVHAEADNVT